MKTDYIHQGDSLEFMCRLPDESINCIITSPPYWALRDYGVNGQLGLEPTFQEYIDKLCTIFDEGKRILKKDGTAWVNIGDTYCAGGTGSTKALENDFGKKFVFKNRTPEEVLKHHAANKRKKDSGIPDKCLCMIPFRFAIEMVNRGWILRNTIIWYKPNCMPCSAKDRFTVDFEYMFFFVKNKRYYFEQQFDDMKPESEDRYNYDFYTGKKEKNRFIKGQNTAGLKDFNNGKRNKRCVWEITTQPFSKAHFAVFPEELIETCILAGCPDNGIVFDPFMGSGTTAKVSIRAGRHWLGSELNPEYIKIANERIEETMPLFQALK